jgi:hypothetical protein
LRKGWQRAVIEAQARLSALPYRVIDDGIKIPAITSRRKGLVVPKGWPMPKKLDALAAAIGADEEAGAKGFLLSTRAWGSTIPA